MPSKVLRKSKSNRSRSLPSNKRGESDRSLVKSAKESFLGIIVSEFNSDFTNKLLNSAKRTLINSGIYQSEIKIYRVPGAFELISGARLAIQRGAIGVIVLGCVIRGETAHFDYVCQGVTFGIAQLNCSLDIPVIFGVLTTDNEKQASDRCFGGAEGDKGEEFARALLTMLNLKAGEIES